MVLAGCASRGHRAPVVDRSLEGKGSATSSEAARKKSQREKDWRPESIVVQKGDTLYSIAFNYGFDYHELAELNGIKDPSVISIGQEIHLFPGKSMTSGRSGETHCEQTCRAYRERPTQAGEISIQRGCSGPDRESSGAGQNLLPHRSPRLKSIPDQPRNQRCTR